MDELQRVLSGVSHLNLEGQIVNKQVHASAFRGPSDLFTAWSERHQVKVAVKRIRVFLRKDASFARVSRSSVTSAQWISLFTRNLILTYL